MLVGAFFETAVVIFIPHTFSISFVFIRYEGMSSSESTTFEWSVSTWFCSSCFLIATRSKLPVPWRFEWVVIIGAVSATEEFLINYFSPLSFR